MKRKITKKKTIDNFFLANKYKDLLVGTILNVILYILSTRRIGFEEKVTYI